MENKKVAILILATAAALLVAALGVYAMTSRQAASNGSHPPSISPGYGAGGGAGPYGGRMGSRGMMGGWTGAYQGHGMMEDWGFPSSMWQYIQQWMSSWWNSASTHKF